MAANVGTAVFYSGLSKHISMRPSGNAQDLPLRSIGIVNAPGLPGIAPYRPK